MGLLINENELVRNVMEQIMPLLSDMASSLLLCIVICTFTYCLREFLKEKRERRLHAEQMKQLQRTGGGRNTEE